MTLTALLTVWQGGTVDIDGLLAVLGKEAEEPPDKPDRREGAGRGGIILGREE